MSSYENHQALDGLTLGKSTDYRDNYDASLLQGVPRSLNRDPLDLKADTLPFHGADIWTLYELSWLNTNGLPQVAVGHVELDYTSVNLIESKSFKLYLNSFNQTRFDSWDAVRQTLENDLRACAQGDVSVALYRLDELEGQPIAHFNGTCIDNQDIVIDNYQFSTAYLENAVSGEKAVEETLVSHLLKSNCLITHQPTGAPYKFSIADGKSTGRSCCVIWSPSATIMSFTSSVWNAFSMTFCASASRRN